MDQHDASSIARHGTENIRPRTSFEIDYDLRVKAAANMTSSARPIASEK